MQENETRFSVHEIQEEFERMGLGNVNESSYPGAKVFTKQYKRCSILREVPVTYSSSTTCKINL